ncbi:hypothetical protein DICSQDRAFT_157415 [Dichomitus squalens LYAD-421 SS1]|uniref:Uncharacterized protein n=1 Tax=Dichomitus squalens (strain LYAD-421) TaxID=732165 RepID=R7SNT5_DICSQ|nr:uncharacterized protein DICSQDRAFT_157415 [Dichomitus squalens LYAD-421 SS1]EJF57395.1 hypothetical protein DICSQDRAFT_157415 [Dichomitus squalens LYAD-421 SS1]
MSIDIETACHAQPRELIYVAAIAGSDDELLAHVARAYPRLFHPEIHRYRKIRTEYVQHVHIARILAGAKSLRTIHLNLNFRDDHGPYCLNGMLRGPWYFAFSTMYGPEIVEESCPLLEYVGFLYHDAARTVWVQFHPSRCAERLVRPNYGPG